MIYSYGTWLMMINIVVFFMTIVTSSTAWQIFTHNLLCRNRYRITTKAYVSSHMNNLIEKESSQVRISPLVDCILRAGLEKKANSMTVVKLSNESNIADYYVILEGNSRPQINAITWSVEEAVSQELNRKPIKQLDTIGGWFSLDYADVIVQVMTPTMRKIYHLEDMGTVINVDGFIEEHVGLALHKPLEESQKSKDIAGHYEEWKDADAREEIDSSDPFWQ